MNERIRELMIQAQMTQEVVKTDENYSLYPITTIEIFAELLVQECCEVLKQEGEAWHAFSRNPPAGQETNAVPALFAAYRLKEDAVSTIKEHFGVEE